MPPFQVSIREFNGRDLLRFCGHPFNRKRDYYDLYQRLPLASGREINVICVLAMMLMERADNAGMPISLVHRSCPNVVAHALTTLASDFSNWHLHPNHLHQDTLAKSLPEKLQETAFVKDIFGFNEHSLSRYLVHVGSSQVLTANCLQEVDHLFNAEAVTLLDSVSLARDFRSRTQASLFNVI